MKTMLADTEIQSVLRGAVVGVIAPAGGWTISQIDTLAAWLRVASLILGIVVSIASLVYIVIKIVRLLRS